MEKKEKFLQKLTNRILVTLLLSVAFPVFCAVFFPIFTFLILPSTSLVSGGMAASYRCLHIYWFVAALVWIVLLAVVLPLMKKDLIMNRVPNDEESKIDLKKLSSRGSRDVLEEESKDEIDDREDIRKSKSISEIDMPINESNFNCVETEATVHETKTGSGSPNATKESDTIKVSNRVGINDKLKASHSEEREFIPCLETNDVMDDEFSAETVISKSYTHRAQRIDTYTSSEETYECSLPSPTSVSEEGRGKNAVFIFVNSENDINASKV